MQSMQSSHSNNNKYLPAFGGLGIVLNVPPGITCGGKYIGIDSLYQKEVGKRLGRGGNMFVVTNGLWAAQAS
jgi:hypothetical protein